MGPLVNARQGLGAGRATSQYLEHDALHSPFPYTGTVPVNGYGAGADHGSDSFAPAAAFLAPSPLRDVPVAHHEPNRLFRQVVPRVDASPAPLRESRLVVAEGAEEAVDLKAAADAEHAAELMARMSVGKDGQGPPDFFGKTG